MADAAMDRLLKAVLATKGVQPTPRMGGLMGLAGVDDLSHPAPSYQTQYNTFLPPEDEAAFMAWAKALSGKKGYDALEDLRDYDLRGAWQSGAEAAANGHLPDTYKKPNHPTFSTGSQYSNQQTGGGEWVDLGNGKWAFRPSPFNMQMTGSDRLQNYFNRVEPGNELLMNNPITPTPVQR